MDSRYYQQKEISNPTKNTSHILSLLFMPLILASILCLTLGCSDTEKQEGTYDLVEGDTTKHERTDHSTIKSEQKEIANLEPEWSPFENLDTLLGIYTINFDDTPARIVINYLNSRKAIGYNIVKGLQRNINGDVNETKDSIFVVLAEPGDHKADGVFYLAWSKENLNGNGYWESNSGNFKRKKFSLSKVEVPERNKYHSNAEITSANFADYFYYVEDTIGNLTFHEDGKVVYSYYEEEDNIHRREQLSSFNGTWLVEGDSVFIHWQPNEVFTSRKTVFYIDFPDDEDTDYYEIPTLESEDRSFYPLWY